MKIQQIHPTGKPKEELARANTISVHRAREIMKEEAVEYTDEELGQVLDFISKIISITTNHYERVKQKQAKIISINSETNTNETTSIPLYPGEHRRAS